MKPNTPMTYDDIEKQACAEITAARDYTENQIAPERGTRWERYHGAPLGNEVDGRSKWQSRDVMDTVEWIMPYLVGVFMSGEPKIEIEIEGRPPEIGKALRQVIDNDLARMDAPNHFVTLYSWIKDALVSNTAAVKPSWEQDVEPHRVNFGMLGESEYQRLAADPDITVTEATRMMLPDGRSMYRNVRATVKRILRDGPRVDPVPHWELIVSPLAREINDEHGKGHTTIVTLDYLRRMDRAYRGADGRPFFRHLEDLGRSAPPAGPLPFANAHFATSDRNAEEQRYRQDNLAATLLPAEKGPRRPVRLTEWYTRIDVDGDGFLEDVVCWVADDRTLLRWERNREGMVQLSTLSPILDCYKFYGIAYADLLVEIQNLKTMLVRRILDNFAYANNGRWRVEPGRGVDVATLLKNVPGDVIYGQAGAIESLAPEPFHPGVLNLVEYADTVKEARSGVTRYNQGMDAQSLNKTAAGITMIQTAAQQRLELVARIMAETGMRDLYTKLARLYQHHLRRPVPVRVNGMPLMLSPENIQGRIHCTANLGSAAQTGMVEAQKIERMFAFLLKANEQYPGILRPAAVYRLSARYIASYGYKATEEFIGSLQDYVQEVQKEMAARRQAADEQKQAWAAEKHLEASRIQGDQALKAREIDTKKQIAEIHAAVKAAGLVKGASQGQGAAPALPQRPAPAV